MSRGTTLIGPSIFDVASRVIKLSTAHDRVSCWETSVVAAENGRVPRDLPW
jgi:hypothetical protein